MNSNEIIGAINSGEVDDDLDTIIDTARGRQERAAIAKAQGFVRGDTVRVVGHIRPKYLIGMEGTVTEVVGGRVGVRMNEERGRVRAGSEATVPAVCVQRVAS